MSAKCKVLSDSEALGHPGVKGYFCHSLRWLSGVDRSKFMTLALKFLMAVSKCIVEHLGKNGCVYLVNFCADTKIKRSWYRATSGLRNVGRLLFCNLTTGRMGWK